mgnify:CR=1 FL=1
MLRSAEVLQTVRTAGQLAVNVPQPTFDWKGVLARRSRLVREFADHRLDTARNLPNVEIIRGYASFESESVLRVNGKSITADKFVIATGSVVWQPNILGLDDVGYLTSDTAQTLEKLPNSLLVFGGGAVAMEFSQLYQRFGVEVTVLQRSSRVLSRMDHDISIEAQRVLEAEGVRFVGSAKVLRFEMHNRLKSCVVRTPAGTERYSADEILCAVGRRPAIQTLNCEVAGVRCDDGWVMVDTALRTTNPRIFAGGDVVGGPEVSNRQLVHVAVQHGEICGHNVFTNSPKQFDGRLIPEAVFTDPAIGAVGLTEFQARQQGHRIYKAVSRFDDHGKAIVMNATNGIVKMIADADSGEILGVHIIGPEGADLIHEAIVAMYYHATVMEFVDIPHLHPTLAEILLEPAEDILGQMGLMTVTERLERGAAKT